MFSSSKVKLCKGQSNTDMGKYLFTTYFAHATCTFIAHTYPYDMYNLIIIEHTIYDFCHKWLCKLAQEERKFP